MKISITRYFTEPDFTIDLSVKFLNLITETIENNILTPYPLAICTSEELEIMLTITNDKEITEFTNLSKSLRGKYLSYSICIPYKLITKEQVLVLPLFADEFFSGLSEIFSGFQIPEEAIKQTNDFIKREIEKNPIYDYVPTEQELNWRNSIKNIKLEESISTE